ncbi:STAS domain-containing protein [Spirillospora sp. CA-294931]|uniref:STAS domain-containing protein n=1 Tax=Spirillospora sp. CA-294931 TaxID=3240042 RepID=UPI003D942BB1
MVELTVTDRVQGDLTIVSARGQIDAFTSGHLRERLTGLVTGGARHLVLDLGDVVFMDSTGLGLLAGLHPVVRACDGSIALVGVNPRIREVLRITTLTRLFPIYRSVEMAVLAHANDANRPSPDAPWA